MKKYKITAYIGDVKKSRIVKAKNEAEAYQIGCELFDADSRMKSRYKCRCNSKCKYYRNKYTCSLFKKFIHKFVPCEYWKW